MPGSSMSISTKLVTAEEFAAMPDDGMFSELIRGEIVSVGPPAKQHGRLVARIGKLLSIRVEDTGKGVVVSGSGVIITRDPDSVLAPDVSVYLGPVIAPLDEPQRYEEITPDIVFEVVSPSDSAANVEDKVALYLESGVKTVVVVWPRLRRLTVRTLGGDTSLGEGDLLTFTELPGVSIAVEEIFTSAAVS
jgi:Uma2 family endonuclease